MMKGGIAGRMASADRSPEGSLATARDSLCLADRAWTRYRRCGRLGPPLERNIDPYPCDNETGRDQLGLGRVESENIVFGIDADLFYKEPFYPIEDQVNGKKCPGN